VTTVADGTVYLARKIAAMTAHATQITVDGEYYALSDNVGRRVSGIEHYIRLAGVGPARPVPADDPFGLR
jgi:N-acetyl-1-D-myo-inositol-2-amino-2-deoxy-alpha-D-glucopyranoside deacetylase